MTLIEMVRKADEIQKAWIPKIGDKVLKNDNYISTIKIILKSEHINKEGLIWIPTHEDLLDLIPICDYKMKRTYIDNILLKLKQPSYLMNSDILEAIMFDKYDKVWNGHTWIRINWR